MPLRRPGHERNLLSPQSGDLPVGRFAERAVQSPLQKYFCFHSPQITSRTLAIPSHTEGRIMIVTNAGWDAVDAAAFCARWDRRAGRKICERLPACRREMLLRTAKSCGPDAPTLASSSR